MLKHTDHTDLALWLRALCDLRKRRAACIHSLQDTTTQDADHLKHYAKALKTSIDSMADVYSKAWNVGCAKNILRNLPQELRDMIYKCLLSHHSLSRDGVDSLRKERRSYTDMYMRSKPEPRVLLSVEDYPHFFDKRFMGINFATELSQVFCSNTKFILQHAGELEDFLSFDRFETGCTPSKHVRAITVRVQLGTFDSKIGHCRSWSSPKFKAPLKQHYLAAVKGLDALKRLGKPSPTVRLRIDCWRDGAGPKFAEVLVPLVYALKDKGCTVELEGDYPHGINEKPPARDFNYDITKKDWEHKVRIKSAFADDDVEHATKSRRGYRLS